MSGISGVSTSAGTSTASPVRLSIKLLNCPSSSLTVTGTSIFPVSFRVCNCCLASATWETSICSLAASSASSVIASSSSTVAPPSNCVPIDTMIF